MALGQSFSPLQQPDQTGNGPGNAYGSGSAQTTPLQQAIQVLQLHLPRFFGSAAPAPAPLLSASPPLANPLDPMDVLRRMLGLPSGSPGLAAAGPPGMGGPPSGIGGPAAPGPGAPPPNSGKFIPATHFQPLPGSPPAPPQPTPPAAREPFPGPGGWSGRGDFEQ